MSVLLQTNVGNITIDLFVKERPRTARNFLKLCKIKYYNGCIFHNVQPEYLIQSGDPTGTGRGGSSLNGLLYGEQARYEQDELQPAIRHTRTGLVGMASAGPHSIGSQFYITTGAPLAELDETHTLVGEVAEGAEVLARINQAFVDASGRPLVNYRVLDCAVLDDPFADPAGLDQLAAELAARPPATEAAERLADRLEADVAEAELAAADAKSAEQLAEELAARERRSREEVLEMIGDIPDADLKPPDNVLFLCKLNPATRDADLELIFSRFGRIRSCEIIRDHKTGDSLCYGFIEFEEERACQDAYFKMNNVLIDDRRIHVDFSQSVAKLKALAGVGKFGLPRAARWAHRGGRAAPSRHGPLLTPADLAAPRADAARYPLLLDSADEPSAPVPAPASRAHHSDHRDRDRDRDRARDRDHDRPHDKDHRRDHDRNPSRDQRRDRDSRDRELNRSQPDRGQRERDPKHRQEQDRDRDRDHDKTRDWHTKDSPQQKDMRAKDNSRNSMNTANDLASRKRPHSPASDKF